MAEEEDSAGASLWEQLQYASKTDSASLAEEVLGNPKLGDDVNKQDGLGMTALHHANPEKMIGTLTTLSTVYHSTYLHLYDPRSAKSPSPDVLELLLEHETTDVDLLDKLDGNTPLHLAVKLEDEEARAWVVRTLLEAGADPKIRNKHRQLAVDLLPSDSELREDFRKAEAELAIDRSDLVQDDSDVDGEEGGSSGEE